MAFACHAEADLRALNSTRDINACRISSPTSTIPFQLSAKVFYIRNGPKSTDLAIGVEDETGCTIVAVKPECQKTLRLALGDTVLISGTLRRFSSSRNLIWADTCSVLRHGPPPVPTNVTITDLLTGRFNYRLTRITGVLRDAATSETDNEWIILLVCDGKSRIFISVPTSETVKELDHLVGKRVSAPGICLPSDFSPRKRLGPTFKISSPADIREEPDDPISRNAAIPDIQSISCISPDEILSLGRHQVTGTVVAVWGDNSAIVRNANEYTGLEFNCGPLPSYGQEIRAIGLPESDLYRINLTRATWEPLPHVAQPEDKPILASPADIVTDGPRGVSVKAQFFGRLVRMNGRVISAAEDTILLKDNNRVFTVNAGKWLSALDGVDIGSTVEITGTCVLESADIHRASKFPKLHDFIIVLRSPDDLRILAKPSWWTPLRLSITIALLLSALVAILTWNMTLHAAIARKNRTLLKEQAEKIAETLKIDERTRLAAELHDYLAQNLTVVSYQISSAQNAIQENRADAKRFIDNADQMLQSCRTDLRHCLWDLKNDALGELDFTKAVLKATSLVAGDASVLARFDIRRTQLTDSTAHAILSICRELVSNAVQHGKARSIRIAGELKDGMIRFSVRDDGCGFDPERRRGPLQGHFGLSGIIERIKRLGGQFEIHSSPGCETRIIATVHNKEHT